MGVTIIGGGMVGTILALALSHLSNGSIQINLVEAQSIESCTHPGFDSRAIALTYGTFRELVAIGVWSELAPNATAITKVEITDKGHLGKVQITASDYKLPALGYVIELHKVSKQLLNLLHKAPGVKLHCPAILTDIRRKQICNVITINNNIQINAQLVVLADGSCSPLAAQCGIRWQQRDYQQIAIISNISTTIPHNGNAFERFTPQGSLALLPISNARSSLIWCLPSSYGYDIANLNEKQFCLALQKAFGWRLGHINLAGERHCYSLKLCIAERRITHRLVLVGNAAQTLHPIAGQGFNLGLRDIITLAETIAQAIAQGKDIGNYALLSYYQRRRQPDQASIVAITDALIHTFTNSYLPLVIGRNIGLLAMAHIPYLRNILVHKMLGWVNR